MSLPRIVYLLSELKNRHSAFSVVFDQARRVLWQEIHSGHISRSVAESILTKQDIGIQKLTVSALVEETDNLLDAEMVSLVGGSADSYAAMSGIKKALAQIIREPDDTADNRLQ